MCYQVVNVEKPNAKTNTTVFNIFEASDCKTNLKFSLSRFKSEIDLLQNTIWREKQIRVFLFGDYKFLCAIYGITGATGRHPCLFCNITRQGMSTPIKDNIEMRSLETLDSHLEKYKNHGSDPKFAKLCDNVIDQRLFNVPLDQIGIPALHISLGTYLKFFNMLEDSCHTIDVKIAGRMAVNNQTLEDCEEFNKYIEKQRQIKQLQISIPDLENKTRIITEALETHILSNPENEEYIKLVFEPGIIHFEEKKKRKDLRIGNNERN
ncbi:uncharacterized protein LOC105850584 [Hydra vulgaris]|uniref:uncharacterized protein LOC105850584 n=1 Tax=Hydra vulgaris TaxID=6087 RepID=UPI001F5F3981|nr:uncharacterized protein LOC105850584 [Hydra vulgaris]